LAEDRWKNRNAPVCFGVFIAYLVSMAFAANHKADKPRHRLKSNSFVVKKMSKSCSSYRLSIPSRRLLLSALNRNQRTVISPKYDDTRTDIFEAVASMKTSFFLYASSFSAAEIWMTNRHVLAKHDSFTS